MDQMQRTSVLTLGKAQPLQRLRQRLAQSLHGSARKWPDQSWITRACHHCSRRTVQVSCGVLYGFCAFQWTYKATKRCRPRSLSWTRRSTRQSRISFGRSSRLPVAWHAIECAARSTLCIRRHRWLFRPEARWGLGHFVHPVVCAQVLLRFDLADEAEELSIAMDAKGAA